jgi:uncharacterized protein YndB with AHSA1/START domain
MTTSEQAESAREIVSTRLLPFPPAQVFRAYSDPQRLARWWGPAGFRNTFEQFDFRPGGDWKFVMHGPDGKDYVNHNVFDAIEPPARIVIRHDLAPPFVATVTFEPEGEGTRLRFRMVFPDARLRDRVASYAVPANEQNFDRLHAELSTPS